MLNRICKMEGIPIYSYVFLKDDQILKNTHDGEKYIIANPKTIQKILNSLRKEKLKKIDVKIQKK